MKASIVVEVSDGTEKVRRLKTVEIPTKVQKLYEVLGTDNLLATVAEDILTNAMKVALVAKPPEEVMSTAQAKDDQGKPTGRSVMEESLGLDIIENMLRKK